MGERYVALGDSYTIGEGVPEHERWPNILAEHLRRDGFDIELVANPSVTGWTSQQLIDHELPVFDASDATFATLLIGVNDWVQGVAIETFDGNLETIIRHVFKSLPHPRRLVLVTIPDFSVSPVGGQYARGRDISAGLAAFNVVIRAQAEQHGLPLADVFPLSQSLTGPQFFAADGLHPSGAAYARWEEVIYPFAAESLSSRPKP